MATERRETEIRWWGNCRRRNGALADRSLGEQGAHKQLRETESKSLKSMIGGAEIP